MNTQGLRALGAFPVQEGPNPGGGRDRFSMSDSKSNTLNAFFAVHTGRTGSNSRNTSGVGMGVLTPGFSKANGAGHAEGLSGADEVAKQRLVAESISGTGEVYPESKN